MGDKAKLGAVLHVERGAGGELVRTIETVGAGKSGVAEVVGVGDEVDVFDGGDGTGVRVRNQRVDVLHAGQRAGQLAGEFHLQRVVNGAADGEQHLVGADIGVLPAEGCGSVRSAAKHIRREAAVVSIAGVEAVAGVVEDGGASGDGAIDRGRIRAGAAAESSVCRGDGVERGWRI